MQTLERKVEWRMEKGHGLHGGVLKTKHDSVFGTVLQSLHAVPQGHHRMGHLQMNSALASLRCLKYLNQSYLSPTNRKTTAADKILCACNRADDVLKYLDSCLLVHRYLFAL